MYIYKNYYFYYFLFFYFLFFLQIEKIPPKMNSPTQLKLAAFQVVCLLANELIEALMGKVCLMTKRDEEGD
jgi:hypothetical protein